MMNEHEAKPSYFSKHGVENIAEVAATRSEYTSSLDIFDAVENLGGKIVVHDFWKDADHTGSLLVSGVGDFRVFIPAHTPIERDRFTIAHELGHYFLHYLFVPKEKRPQKMRANRYGSGRVEWEANWFAAAFLLPSAKFRKIYNLKSGDHSAIASNFGVSESAVKIRAISLGLIQE